MATVPNPPLPGCVALRGEIERSMIAGSSGETVAIPWEQFASVSEREFRSAIEERARTLGLKVTWLNYLGNFRTGPIVPGMGIGLVLKWEPASA